MVLYGRRLAKLDEDRLVKVALQTNYEWMRGDRMVGEYLLLRKYELDSVFGSVRHWKVMKKDRNLCYWEE